MASSLLKKYVLKMWYSPLGLLIGDIGPCRYLQGSLVMIAMKQVMKNVTCKLQAKSEHGNVNSPEYQNHLLQSDVIYENV